MTEIRITEEELCNIIKECVHQVIYENNTVEMRGNVNDFRYLPYNKYDVEVWPNDHQPPHFHVLIDGWDISFKISDGSLLKINRVGKGSQNQSYLIKFVPDWLNDVSDDNSQITNRENLMNMWNGFQANRQ